MIRFLGRELPRVTCLLLVSVPAITGTTLTCYHCKSQAGDGRACEEPALSKLESNRRSCPADEKCVKIVQSAGDASKRVVIRDCYKTRSLTDGYFTSLDYYGSKLDGSLYICEQNLCNSQSVTMPSLGLVLALAAATLQLCL